MSLESVTTPEGLRIYVDTLPTAETAHIDVVIGAGSVHEPKGSEGLSHALEHCVYLGGNLFKNEQALNEFDGTHSIIANAYTDYSNTRFYARGPIVDPIMRRMGEMLFRTKFKPMLVSKQMDVITQEASLWRNDPDALHAAASQYGLFGTRYGRMTIGYADKINFTPEQLYEYYKRHYVQSNMAIVAVGNVRIEEIVKGVEDYFDATDQFYENVLLPEPRRLDVDTTGLLRDDAENAQISISTALDAPFIAHYLHNKELYDAAMSAIGSECYEKLCIKSSISYSGDVSFETQNHPNAWRIQSSTTVHPNNVNTARLLLEQVTATPGKKYSKNKIASAIGTRISRILSTADSIEERADSYVKSLVSNTEPTDIRSAINAIYKVTPGMVSEVIDCIAEHVDMSRPMTHITGPKKVVKDMDKRINASILI